MRMRTNFEAYFDDFNCINVFMSKNFYNGNSSIFHLKDTHDRSIPLTIRYRSELYNGYFHYDLSLNASSIQMGEEYTIYDEHCRTAIVKYGHIVKTVKFNDTYTYRGKDLGLHYTPTCSTFKLWSPTAYSILLFLNHDGNEEVYSMKRNAKGLYEVSVHKNCLSDPYYFLVRVNGSWRKIVDPYTSFSGPNSKYSVVMDMSLLDLPEKVKMPPLHNNCDAIVYEASIRDMTSMPDIGVSYPKKFQGFTQENETTKEKCTGFSYLRSLGITHVQLMPVFDFGSVDEVYPNIFYNWGYDPVQFRCLEGSYDINPIDATSRVKAFAQLVANCHKAGIRVNLDLVFNHVYDKETFSLENLVPNYYFLMNREGAFSNGSFCGNDYDSQAPMAREYLVETCRRIVEWFDVDGFRFDLMGILDINVMNEIASVCKKIKPDFMIYGEGWNMPSFVSEDLRATQKNQHKMPHIGHFSDSFRNVVRGSDGQLTQKGFSSGDTSMIYSMMDRMSASGNIYDSPEKVINYVECHDNHTLWDKNQICCSDENKEIRKKRQVLATAMVLLSQGVPFIHSGQEFCRTKQGLGNSYNRSDNYNKIDYDRRNLFQDVVNQTKTLIQIRKDHPCFRLSTVEKTRENTRFQTIEDDVLIYECNDKEDSCISFFNPTGKTYHYVVSDDVQILFDNGNDNKNVTREITIAPYAVVVGEYQ